MTSPDPYPLPPRRLGLFRDVTALLLILAGIAGIVVVALHLPWQTNVAAGSVAAIAAGVSLGMTR